MRSSGSSDTPDREEGEVTKAEAEAEGFVMTFKRGQTLSRFLLMNEKRIRVPTTLVVFFGGKPTVVHKRSPHIICLGDYIKKTQTCVTHA